MIKNIKGFSRVKDVVDVYPDKVITLSDGIMEFSQTPAKRVPEEYFGYKVEKVWQNLDFEHVVHIIYSHYSEAHA